MEFRWHDLDADRDTICASRPGRGANDLRFGYSKGSALRRVQRNLLGRHMALGWIHVTVDAGDTTASPFRCHWVDAFSRSKWQCRSFGGFDGHFYQLTMWQWNGTDWTQLFPPTVPFARSSAAVATNTSTGQVVMFGGLADVNPNNTWTYDGTT